MNQSNLRAACLYLISLIAYQSINLILAIMTGSFDLYDLLLLIFRLFQIVTGIWIVIGLLSSKRKQRDYTRLIGLYLLFSISDEIIAELFSRTLLMPWIWPDILSYLLRVRTAVTTILSTYVSIKVIRKQIDQNLFLILSIIQIMYIVREVYYPSGQWMFLSIIGMEAIVNLIGFCTNLGFYSILAILFYEISGRKFVFNGDEKRVINWLGVALFLIGFRYLISLFWILVFERFGFQLWQIVTLLVFWGIQAFSLIYLSIRVRAHISQE